MKVYLAIAYVIGLAVFCKIMEHCTKRTPKPVFLARDPRTLLHKTPCPCGSVESTFGNPDGTLTTERVYHKKENL